MTILRLYNLTKIGVDVDTDNLRVLPGAWRQAQNLHPSSNLEGKESITNRDGLRNLNSVAMGSGPILGGVVIPAFLSGEGDATLFLGFGD